MVFLLGQVPDSAWLGPERQGLVFCDASYAAFSVALPWDKLDVTAFSIHEALGTHTSHLQYHIPIRPNA